MFLILGIVSVPVFGGDNLPTVTGEIHILLDSCRVLDTRSAAAEGPVPANTEYDFSVRNFPADNQGGFFLCGIPDEAIAVLLNFVVINPAGKGWASVYRRDTPSSGPSSSITFMEDFNTSNLVWTAINTAFGGDLSLKSTQEADFAADIQGYMLPKP